MAKDCHYLFSPAKIFLSSQGKVEFSPYFYALIQERINIPYVKT